MSASGTFAPFGSAGAFVRLQRHFPRTNTPRGTRKDELRTDNRKLVVSCAATNFDRFLGAHLSVLPNRGTKSARMR